MCVCVLCVLLARGAEQIAVPAACPWHMFFGGRLHGVVTSPLLRPACLVNPHTPSHPSADRVVSVMLSRGCPHLRTETDGACARNSTVSLTESVISALDSLDLALADFQNDVVARSREGGAGAALASHTAGEAAMPAQAGGMKNAAPVHTGPLVWSKEAQVRLSPSRYVLVRCRCWCGGGVCWCSVGVGVELGVEVAF